MLSNSSHFFFFLSITEGHPNLRYRGEVYAFRFEASNEMISISDKIISTCISSPFHVPKHVYVTNPSLTGHMLLDRLIYDLYEFGKASAEVR